MNTRQKAHIGIQVRVEVCKASLLCLCTCLCDDLWTVFRSSLRTLFELTFSERLRRHKQVNTFLYLVGKIERDKSKARALRYYSYLIVCVLSSVFVCVCS